MVILRKRPLEDRIHRLMGFQLARIEDEQKRAKGPKRWVERQIERLAARIARIHDDDAFWNGLPLSLRRALGHLGDRRSRKAHRRRRQRDAAATRRAVERYLAERGIDPYARDKRSE